MTASPVARHVQSIPRSGIRDFFEIVQSMRASSSLGIGEPDFVTPWHIREAAIYALERGRPATPPISACPSCAMKSRPTSPGDFGSSTMRATEVLVAVGVSEALDLALRALLNPGDEVLYHEPCYVSYSPSIALAHGVPVAVETHAEDGFKLAPRCAARARSRPNKGAAAQFPDQPDRRRHDRGGTGRDRGDLPRAQHARDHRRDLLRAFL